MAHSRQVSADLVRSSTAWHGLDQTQISIKALDHFEFCVGCLTMLGIDNRAMAAIAIGAQWQADSFFMPGGIAQDQGMVGLGDLVPFELEIKLAMRLGAARQHQEPARLAIQAVYNP